MSDSSVFVKPQTLTRLLRIPKLLVVTLSRSVVSRQSVSGDVRVLARRGIVVNVRGRYLAACYVERETGFIPSAQAGWSLAV